MSDDDRRAYGSYRPDWDGPVPAATPARDEADTRTEADRELREQIAAALHGAWCQCDGGGVTQNDTRSADAVLPVVDAWVAAHTAEVAALVTDHEAMSLVLHDAEAAVARVRALCDEWDRSCQSLGDAHRSFARLRAALPEPTDGA